MTFNKASIYYRSARGSHSSSESQVINGPDIARYDTTMMCHGECRKKTNRISMHPKELEKDGYSMEPAVPRATYTHEIVKI